MPEESYTFAQTQARLEEIVAQVRKKDVSLEKSLDLLEEGVRLANQCTELIDRADWETADSTDAAEADVSADATDVSADEAGDAAADQDVESA